MAEKRDILWRFLGDAKGLNKATKDAGRSLGGVEKKVGGVTKAVGALGLAIGARELLSFAGDAIGAASAAEEAESKFQAIFSEDEGLAKRVEALGDKTGIATSKMNDMFGTLGNLATNAGLAEDSAFNLTEDVGILAGDLASFNDSNPEEVFNDLAFAITTTERDALKKYGITLGEAEVKQRALEVAARDGREEFTKADKIYASYELALEGAGGAVGDLERTSESFANKQRRVNASILEAKEAFGEELIPVVEDLLPLAEDLIPLIGKIGGLFGAAAKNVTAFSDAVSPTDQVGKDVGSAWDRTTDVLAGFSDLLSRTPLLITPVQERFGRLRDTLNEVGESYEKTGKKAEEGAKTEERAAEDAERAGERWREANEDVVESIAPEEFQRRVDALVKSTEDAVLKIVPKWAEVLGVVAATRGELDELAPAFERVGRRVVEIEARGSDAPRYRHTGGVVPGIGDQLIMAQGGERVTRKGQPGHDGGGGVTINFNGVVGDPDAVAAEISDLLQRYQQTNGTPLTGLSEF